MIPVLYFVVAFLAWPWATAFIARSMQTDGCPFNASDWAISTIFGLLAALVWPLAALSVYVVRVAKHLVDDEEDKEKTRRE